jgi:hypothetical protein
MQKAFDAVVDRTRSRLDVPKLRTLFGAKVRPHRDRAGGPPRLAAVIETPVHDLTIFKVWNLRALDVEGVHQRRTRAAVRGCVCYGAVGLVGPNV